MRRTLAFILAGVGILGLTACGNSDYKYVPPSLSPQAAAIVTGSRTRNTDPITPDTRVFLASIDGQLTLDGPHGWDDRTSVAPGAHVIRFGVAKNQLFAPPSRLGHRESDNSTEIRESESNCRLAVLAPADVRLRSALLRRRRCPWRWLFRPRTPIPLVRSTMRRRPAGRRA